MKVLLVSEYFYPHSTGGTEQYVYELAGALTSANINTTILAVSTSADSYRYNNLEVHTIPFNTNLSKEVIGGIVAADNLQAFINKIKELQPDVIHFHTLTTSIGVFHYQAAHKTGAKVFFTSHIPGNTCLRGDLMRYGEKVCDGKVRLNTCLACYLNANGMPKAISPLAAKAMRVLKYPTILSQASAIKKQQLEKIKAVCSNIVTMSNWQQQVFLINGFAPTQLILSRHTFKGIPLNFKQEPQPDTITIGFAGRISPEKGLHILIEAFKKLDSKLYTLQIAGIKHPEHKKYMDGLLAETEELKNIHWHFDYTPDTISSFYQQINVLCIPSVCNETGPFVMFEAIARHIPVIASNIGGMQEWAGLNYPVKTYEFDNAAALTQLLKEFPGNMALTYNYPPQKTAADLANEMIKIYSS
jgi:glycosyltransferase involved in cell wall biosynthesis